MNFEYFYNLLQENLKRKIDVYKDGVLIGQKDETDFMTNRVAAQSDVQSRLKQLLAQKMQTAENFRKQTQAAREELMRKRDLSPIMRKRQMAEIEQQEQMISDEINQIRSQAIRQGGQELLKQILSQVSSSSVAKNNPQNFGI